jgi:hypothetical protein
MAHIDLPENATLRTVASELTEEYVRRVLDRMWKNERIGDGMLVSIGLAHQGGFPDYHFHAFFDPEDPDQGTFCGAYSGKTHREIQFERAMRRPWSAAYMTLKEVSVLMGEFRKARKGQA